MIACRPIVGQNGFGNEFMNVAKAIVCARELGAKFVKTRWPEPYARLLTHEFHEPYLWRHRLRFLRYRLTHRVVEVDQPFCERMVEGSITTGLRRHMREHGLTMRDDVLYRISYFPEMKLYPGIGCVLHDIAFLQSVVLRNRAIAAEVDAMARRFDGAVLNVGVHIRRGDFLPEIPFGEKWPITNGTMLEMCRRVPLEWYRHLCTLLRATFGPRVRFFLSSNGHDPDLADFEREFSCLRGIGGEERTPRDVVDLLTLSRMDLLVASPSWFSMWAIAFSGRPFVWYEPAFAPPTYLSTRQPCFLLVKPDALPRDLVEYGLRTLATRTSDRAAPRLD